MFGTRVAVLAGDFLFAQASWLIANLENLEVRSHCIVSCCGAGLHVSKHLESMHKDGRLAEGAGTGVEWQQWPGCCVCCLRTVHIIILVWC